MSAAARPWLQSSHPITPRRPSLDLRATPRYWAADDPLGTQLLNVMQLLTPAPERWFCRSFREALPQITDARLREAALAFIKQEGAHSHGHRLALQRIQTLGVDTRAYDRFMDWLFDDMLGPKPLGRTLKTARAQQRWLQTRLGMVAATEHLTTVLGHWALNAKGLDDAPIDPTMLKLYRWHSAEEVEHREVADALYRHLSGNPLLRAGTAVFVFPLFAALAVSSAWHLVHNDPDLPHRLRLRDYLRAARQGRVPSPATFIKGTLRYFRPGHSPLSEGSSEQALAYLRTYEKAA